MFKIIEVISFIGLFNDFLLKKFAPSNTGMTQINLQLLKTSYWNSQLIKRARIRLYFSEKRSDENEDEENEDKENEENEE